MVGKVTTGLAESIGSTLPGLSVGINHTSVASVTHSLRMAWSVSVYDCSDSSQNTFCEVYNIVHQMLCAGDQTSAIKVQ